MAAKSGSVQYGLTWEEPPEVKNGRPAQWPTRLDPLKARPGSWACVATQARGDGGGSLSRTASFIKSGVYGGGFEAVTRTVDGQTRLYARFVGDGEDSAQ